MNANVTHAEEIGIANRFQEGPHFRLCVGAGNRNFGDI